MTGATDPHNADKSRTHEVIVVGAGLAGLVAATRLREAGVDTVVLESCGEVGGRTRSRLLAGRVIDVGGELVGQNYERLRRLIAGLGLHLEANASLPRPRFAPGSRPPLRLATATGVAAVARHLRQLCRDLPDDAPWQAAGAHELDRLSLADWLDRTPLDGRTARLLAASITSFTTAPPERLSLLHFLVWIKPAGGLSALWRDTRWRIREGAQEISRRLAARLHPRVVVNTPVQRIDQTTDLVTVHTTDGTTWLARHVAVCVPLAATAEITIQPDLPPALRRLHTETQSPPVTKLIAVPARGGNVLAAGDALLPLATRDPHHAIGFAYGGHADLPADQLQQRLLDQVALTAHDTDAITIYRWHHQPYAAGGYPAFTPGQLTHHGPALRADHGRIHFAGGDRSSWPGTMEGAVRDGERLATHLVALRHDE